MVDARNGKAFDLLTLPVRQMGMTLAPFDAALPLLRIRPSSSRARDACRTAWPGCRRCRPPKACRAAP